MRAFKRSRIAVPLISIMAGFALSAQAQEQHEHKPPQQGQGRPAAPAVRQVTPRTGGQAQTGGQQGAGQATGQPQMRRAQGVQGPQGAQGQRFNSQGQRVVRGNYPVRNFGGRPYRGRMAWEGGRWRHEMHNGRFGWWWDVGGVWYFYPQQMDGPPTYVSDVEVMDDVADVDDGPAGYPAPAAAYAPPPPPAPDPGASAVGGAIIGGVLGGLITGRPAGAAIGAVTGGTIGAISGAQAAARQGYYLAQGNCYYRYPSGQYVQVDPRSCY